ncbi:MAG: hypothetical protein LBK60_03070 [Verrucomicrobiales bacterium]|jgi:predicted site-specific integrase-resolvase|nr:hypothetical protein [Verrucomicrobiales bacterium]
MRPIIISAAEVRRLVHPEISRATLARWTREAGVKPVFCRGRACYYKVSAMAKMLQVEQADFYDRVEAVGG